MSGEQKKRKQKREMSEEERAQCKKDKLKKNDNATRVANRQNNYNSCELCLKEEDLTDLSFLSHYSSSSVTECGFI